MKQKLKKIYPEYEKEIKELKEDDDD